MNIRLNYFRLVNGSNRFIKYKTAKRIITTLAILLKGYGVPTAPKAQSNTQTISQTITNDNKIDAAALNVINIKKC